MAGIQPSNGVAPNLTSNALANPNLAAGCANLWYALRCNPRLDPAAMNAMISEIINAVNSRCDPSVGSNAYDCNRLDNLALALDRPNVPVATDCSNLLDVRAQTDAAGCVRLVRLAGPPLPAGLQSYVSGITGSYTTDFTAGSPARLPLVEAANPDPDARYYRCIDTTPIILDPADFCALGVAGNRITVDIDVRIGYFMDAPNTPRTNLGPYQWGFAVFVNGVFNGDTGPDHYATHNSGENENISERAPFLITSTGAPIAIDIIPYVKANTTHADFNPNHTINTDMARIVARYDAFQ